MTGDLTETPSGVY